MKKNILHDRVLFFFCIFFLSISSLSQAAVKSKTDPNAQMLQGEGQINAPPGTPTYAIQQIEKKMEAYKTDKDLTSAEEAENRKIKSEILRGTFNIRLLSQLALDRHWKGINEGQRSHFVNLMTSLLETKAIFSKEQSKTRGENYVVRYLGDTYANNKSSATTKTLVTVPKKNITVEIEYKLKKEGGDWKAYDIIVDGASLVQNYKFQFNNIIIKHGYTELVSRMTEKLNELKNKQS